MSKNHKPSLNLNITVLLLAVLLGVSVFVIVKTILDIKDLNNTIYNQRVDLEIKYQQGLSLKKTTEQIETSKKRLQAMDNIILEKEETLDFINDLEVSADQYQITYNLNIPEFEKPTIATPIPFHLTLVGSYDKILDFISVLHQKPYYINIYRTSFSKVSQEGLADKVSASLDANIYWK